MHDDEQLVSHLAQGDESALETLYHRHSRSLYSLAFRITGDSVAAEDLLQDTFFQLWRKASQFDAARGSLIGWLLTITRRRAISHVRAKRWAAESYEDGSQELSSMANSEALEQQIARELVSAALVGLPESQLQAISLAYFDGFTCEEIARHANVPLGTVKSRLRFALKRMKRNLTAPRRRVLPQAACEATLETILITHQLSSRRCRPRNPQLQADCLHRLGRLVAASPEQLIDSFLAMALELCCAGSTGFSLLETDATGEQIFRWTHLAGQLARYIGGTTPRNFSPCGVTLDRNSPQLFAWQARYFRYFEQVDIPIVEALVLPFHAGPMTTGTLWIASHDESVQFDSEDVRIMTGLTEFIGCALHLIRCFASESHLSQLANPS